VHRIIIHRWVRTIHSEGLCGAKASRSCLNAFSLLCVVCGLGLAVVGIVLCGLIASQTIFVNITGRSTGESGPVQLFYLTLSAVFSFIFFLYTILACVAARKVNASSEATKSLVFLFVISFLLLAALTAQVAVNIYYGFVLMTELYGMFVLRCWWNNNC
jgi:hypothetical protein